MLDDLIKAKRLELGALTEIRARLIVLEALMEDLRKQPIPKPIRPTTEPL